MKQNLLGFNFTDNGNGEINLAVKYNQICRSITVNKIGPGEYKFKLNQIVGNPQELGNYIMSEGLTLSSATQPGYYPSADLTFEVNGATQEEEVYVKVTVLDHRFCPVDPSDAISVLVILNEIANYNSSSSILSY